MRTTAIVRVSSHKSGGRAKLVVAMKQLRIQFTDNSLTSREFANFPVGTYLEVILEVNPSSRRIVSLEQIENSVAARKIALLDRVRNDESEWDSLFSGQIRGNKTAVLRQQAVEQKVEVPSYNNEIDESAYFLSSEEQTVFELALRMAQSHPAKILSKGDSGYGKTSAPRAFAKANNLNYVRVNCALVATPEEFFGIRTVENNSIVFLKSEFTKAIEAGNVIVVLDELNRASPELANGLFPILDDDAKTTVFGEEVKVGPNTIIVATINVGYKFSGTYTLDTALVNRFDIHLNVGPLEPNIESVLLTRRTGIAKSIANKIVEINNVLRRIGSGEPDEGLQVDVSTRTSLKIAKLVAHGLQLADAYKLVVENACSIEERKTIIDTVQQKLQ